MILLNYGHYMFIGIHWGFIVLSFICDFCLAFDLACHNSVFLEKKAQEAKGCSQSELALPSQGIETFVIPGIETAEDDLGITSFCRSYLPSTHHSRNGSLEANAMEVQVLQKIEQGSGDLLWSVWQALDRSLGWQL